jgi:hypothetical protein
MTRTEKIRQLRSGSAPMGKIEYPLFRELVDGNYVAGDFKLSPTEFEKLNKKMPCFL